MEKIDCDFGELSGVGVCFCIGRNSIMGFVLGGLKKHRRDSSMGYVTLVTTSLCFLTHADSSITHYIGVNSPTRTNVRNTFISAEKFVLMRCVLFASFVTEVAGTFRVSNEK